MAMKTFNVNVYTDGACSGNPGPGGMGYVVVMGDDKDPLFNSNPRNNGFRRTTNNRMEIHAAAKALNAVTRFLFEESQGRFLHYLGHEQEAIRNKENVIQVNVYSDSQLVIGTVNQGWKRKSNHDLWKALDEAIANLTDGHNVKVEFIKVKGHDGNKWNEMADRLAVAASEGSYGIDEAYEETSPLPAESKAPAAKSAPATKATTVANISLIGQDTPAERIVEILLSNGTTVTVIPCHGGFEQTGCTQGEAALTADIAWRFVGWLNGHSL